MRAETDGAAGAQPMIEDFFESKLHPPPARTALVSRPAIVERLAGASDVPIASVVAPAGYGKTTILAEWARRDSARVAWLSLDLNDNDIDVLVAYVVAALNRLAPQGPERAPTRPRRRSVAGAASQLAHAMSGMQSPTALVLDHVELLDNQECLDTIAELALHLPAGSRLALASRAEPPIPMPRFRARGDVLEVGVTELAMTHGEARALLSGAGIDAADDDVAQLVERTEGWPVGLYLAALALKAGGSRQDAGIAFSGDDRLVADYLRTEVLDRLSEHDVEFLTRTSVFERMSASLCDATLDTSGSHLVLESLARSNLLLVALDRRGDWYRYHLLFRDLLRRELDRREPGIAPVLHQRAAQWCAANGLAELAIEHAIQAGDGHLVNDLLVRHGVGAYAGGRATSLRRWLQWFDEQHLVQQYPAAAVVGALFLSSSSATGEADYWLDAVEHAASDLGRSGPADLAARAAPDRVLPDGSSLESWRAVLRIITTRDGATTLRKDAEIALAGLSPDSGYRAIAFAGQALAAHLEGDVDSADIRYAETVDVARFSRRLPAATLALAERGSLAASRNDWDAADEFARQSLAVIAEGGLDDYFESAFGVALAARVAVHRGDAHRAGEYVARAARLRPLMTHLRPILSIQTLLELGRAYVALDDTGGAREVVRQAREILRRRPDLGNLPDQVNALGGRANMMRSAAIGASSLTAAELRVVPYLPTHLTFPQIAQRLIVSRNTVKSQVIAVYQKLGVSSRADAVERLHELGLLEV